MGVRRQLLSERRVGDRQLEPVAKGAQLGFGHLLDLVGRVAGFEVRPERPALHRLRQDHTRCVALIACGGVRGVDLGRIVTTPSKTTQFVVGEIGDEFRQSWIRSEEVVADIGAVLDSVLLELAVDGRVHLVDENTVGVRREQRVPLTTPHQLDDVPAGAAKQTFELLNDLRVAPHRPVEALEVAVDHEDQIVEMFPAGQRDAGQALGLVHLAIAGEAPDARRWCRQFLGRPGSG